MNLFSKAILSAAIIGIALTGCGEKKDNHLKVGAIAGAETQVAEEAAVGEGAGAELVAEQLQGSAVANLGSEPRLMLSRLTQFVAGHLDT